MCTSTKDVNITCVHSQIEILGRRAHGTAFLQVREDFVGHARPLLVWILSNHFVPKVGETSLGDGEFVRTDGLTFRNVAAEIASHLPLCTLGEPANTYQGAEGRDAFAFASRIVRLRCDR